ncbi:hypothetical protein DEO72_LG10g1679 [Vigna unguiculata]|uniref:Uncharacterized protein n=1 Tax=Vigna unguiculata TaxID=3917 RepID=A0A4D6ND38_VIGUN|nr:hypothetical protein DEO72_LG10g1679 [Vigna unguiculata]
MDGGGCRITSTRGVWLCGTMVVGCRFRLCVVRGREMERWSGAGESFSKKKNVCAGGRRRRSGRGRGRGKGIRVRVSRWEGFWGFWAGRWENVEKRCVWCGKGYLGLCVWAEGQERGLCVCGKKTRRGFEGALEKWRSGRAVERCSGAVKEFSKTKKKNARTGVWEMWQRAVTTRACAENDAS